MQDGFHYADSLGPEKIVHIYEPALNLRAIVVIDNTAAGPAIGGTRIAPDVSLEECFRLARAMTLKNAAAGLPHGGAKSVIFADPGMEDTGKEQLIRAFAASISELSGYIPGPDMGTNERAMAWVHSETRRSVGLPREIGGIPLDEIGATGYGIAAAAEAVEEIAGIQIKGARVVVQGFGAVGYHAARFLEQRGAILVGAADSRAAIVAEDGLSTDALRKVKLSGKPLSEFQHAQSISSDRLLSVECDFWIPAARPDVIRADNVDQLKARVVIQGANIPVTAEAERVMHGRGILSIPDFIANAGGVITASVEYHGGSEQAALAAVREKVHRNTREVLNVAREASIPPRDAAVTMARARVERAMSFRRWHG